MNSVCFNIILFQIFIWDLLDPDVCADVGESLYVLLHLEEELIKIPTFLILDT